MERYDHKKIEKCWQEKWEEEKLYETPDKVKGKKNYYQLVEFAYPSGNLHVGHWYAFAMPDMYARYKRMNGNNVLFPFGFDAFGLPAENAAIKRNLNPRDWTHQNIETMHRQLKSMGASFDWSREVTTSNPDYYKWTQWLFLKLFERGLAYQAETSVNWCPSCKTVLANEQVKARSTSSGQAGVCERCETEVEQRKMKQWMLKITKYADRLLDDLEELDWPEPIKEAQRSWIGRSEGAVLKFEIRSTKSETNSKSEARNSKQEIEVFTTRADTLFGVTYLVLSPEHKEVTNLKKQATNEHEIDEYVKRTSRKTELERQENKEKTGVALKGVTAINPGNGEEIPVWVADYVLGGVGTGAIMAVPAHDERDYEFAVRHNLPIREVVSPRINAERTQIHANDAYTGEGIIINSGEFDGLSSQEAREKVTEKYGKRETAYRLRDWIVSRQRYWGCPIPLVFCSACKKRAGETRNKKQETNFSVGEEENPGWVAVAEKDLPVELPELNDFLPTGDGKSPLASHDEFVNTKCPKCGGDAERETDTLDTFVDSSWYFLRYLDSHNDKEFASRERQDKWMPIDRYSGGAEHTTMHLLYSRFFHKALFDLGLVADSEPYTRRMNRGIILGPGGQKMSKSKGNVVDPDVEVEKYGADTVRMYLAFIGPYNEVGAYPWNPKGIVGVRRFLERVWKLFEQIRNTKSETLNKSQKSNSKSQTGDTERELHKVVRGVTDAIERFKFNTGVSTLMKFLNEAEKTGLHTRQAEVFVRLLAPLAPHMAEELWREVLGHEQSVHLQPWPEYDEKLFESDEVTIAIQVNGKVRAEMTVPADISDEEVKKRAGALKQVKKRLMGKAPERIVYVPGRLVNVVVDD